MRLQIKFESLDEKNIYEYDVDYIHNEARVSNVYNTLMLFRYDYFVVIDTDNNIIAEINIPNYENVYDQQYIRENDGDYLEVTYYDGSVVRYSAKDGEFLEEYVIDKPNTNIEDVFYTSSLYFKSPLHGNVEVFSKEDHNKAVKELSFDGYLTYVTEVNEHIILQYITTDNYVYGIMLNENLEVVGELPYLSDIVDSQLIFDLPNGKIRKSNLLSLDELLSFKEKQ